MERDGQFCPVAKTAEVLCERWVPLIVRELLGGSRRFTEIHRGVPRISPPLPTRRLRQLESAGVINRVEAEGRSGYMLTDAGTELYPIIQAMGVWGQRWVRSSYSPDELDPALLLWDMRRMLQPSGLASGRTVVEVHFVGSFTGQATYWMVIDDAVDICVTDPGHAVDLWLQAELRCLTEVWMGDRTMVEALRGGAIRLDGPRELVRRFPHWLGHHPILGDVADRRTLRSY